MEERMSERANKTALVTGAAGSLGFAVSKALIERGMNVIMLDVDQARMEKLAMSLGERATAISADLGNPTDVEKAWNKIKDKYDAVDIVVNNAGILSNNKLETTTPEEWRKIMEININGMFFLTRLIVPAMKKKHWGRIINTSSLAAKSGGITAGTAYSTSKGAVISFTFSLAAELAPYGITVNSVAPAYIRTPMVMEQLTAEQRNEIIKKIPVGRLCEPEEFAHVVLFLIDDKAGFITGEIIDQNGGLHFD
jgi:3-oxoacyl-[acyl-carrier protein] reductase